MVISERGTNFLLRHHVGPIHATGLIRSTVGIILSVSEVAWVSVAIIYAIDLVRIGGPSRQRIPERLHRFISEAPYGV